MTTVYILANYMVAIILVLGVATAFLYTVTHFRVRARSRQLLDSLKNIIKGVTHVPDHDSSRTLHDEISGLLKFIGSLQNTHRTEYDKVVENTRRQHERLLDSNTFAIESSVNMGGVMVQVFPLLGILGTILAIATTAGQSEVVDPAAVTSAFVIAMDTTILGILFAVVFMFVDSVIQSRAQKYIDESTQYRALFDALFMENGSRPAPSE